MNQKIMKFIAILLTLFSLAACAPLQQAPLVYSSKVVVGLDFSTNTTENPGASINIGVKSIDAAYVPVAVSKAAYKGEARKDDGSIEVMKIYAEYGQAANNKNMDQLSEENKAKIETYVIAKNNVNAAQSEVDEANKKISIISALMSIADDANSKINSIKIAGIPPSWNNGVNNQILLDDGADGPLVDLNEKIKKINGHKIEVQFIKKPVNESDLLAVQKNLKDFVESRVAEREMMKVILMQKTTERDEKKKISDQKLAQAAEAANLLQTSKKDALSVFGRFNSFGDAGNNGTGTDKGPRAGLTVGKMFSTGLASQNLTEAVKRDAVSNCLLSLATVLDKMPDTAKKNIAAQIQNICKPIEPDTK